MPISLDDFTTYATIAKHAVSGALPPSVAFVLITAMEGAPIILHSNTADLEDVTHLLAWALESAQSGDMSRIDQ